MDHTNSNGSLHAIETRYRGWRFRSRLEARWAVFFDALNIQWQYEPEGFKLSDGTCYLPDFYLPQIRTWAEVKPTTPTVEERHKSALLVTESRSALLWLVEQPDFRNYEGLSFDSGDLTHCEFSLDIYEHYRYYDRERRLFSCPGVSPTDQECSEEYRAAVYCSRAARFDRKDYPQLGNEPFNLSDREMERQR